MSDHACHKGKEELGSLTLLEKKPNKIAHRQEIYIIINNIYIGDNPLKLL